MGSKIVCCVLFLSLLLLSIGCGGGAVSVPQVHPRQLQRLRQPQAQVLHPHQPRFPPLTMCF